MGWFNKKDIRIVLEHDGKPLVNGAFERAVDEEAVRTRAEKRLQIEAAQKLMLLN